MLFAGSSPCASNRPTATIHPTWRPCKRRCNHVNTDPQPEGHRPLDEGCAVLRIQGQAVRVEGRLGVRDALGVLARPLQRVGGAGAPDPNPGRGAPHVFAIAGHQVLPPEPPFVHLAEGVARTRGIRAIGGRNHAQGINRERNLPLLGRHDLRRYAHELRREVPEVGPEAIERLRLSRIHLLRSCR